MNNAGLRICYLLTLSGGMLSGYPEMGQLIGISSEGLVERIVSDPV